MTGASWPNQAGPWKWAASAGPVSPPTSASRVRRMLGAAMTVSPTMRTMPWPAATNGTVVGSILVVRNEQRLLADQACTSNWKQETRLRTQHPRTGPPSEHWPQ